MKKRWVDGSIHWNVVFIACLTSMVATMFESQHAQAHSYSNMYWLVYIPKHTCTFYHTLSMSHACTCTHTCTHLHTCMHTHTCTHLHTCMHTCRHARMHTCVCACEWVSECACGVCVCTVGQTVVISQKSM